MSSIPVVFLGTPEFASYHLRSLLEGSLFRVVGVVSQPDRRRGRRMQWEPSEVKKLALEKGVEVITPERVNSDDCLYQIQLWKAEVAIVIAFGQILSQNFLDLFPKKVVNVHGSLLPRWRGAAPIQRSLMAGDLLSGVVLQVMVKELDAGDIIGRRELSLGTEMNAIELHDYLKVLGVDLLNNELVQYLRGEIQPQPQDVAQVTYARKIDKRESHINWGLRARDIHNHLRGMVLGPGMYTLFRGQQLKIHRVQVLGEEAGECVLEGGDGLSLAGDLCGGEGIVREWKKSRALGRVVHVDRQRGVLVVACSEGTFLNISEVQLESRARMSVKDFLRGVDLNEGEIFT